MALTGALDNEHTRLRTGNGRFFRNVTGATVRGEWSLLDSRLVLAPVVRQELASQYSGARDYRLSALMLPLEDWQFLAGFAYDHAYPSVLAYTGYLSSFGLVRANKDLGVERHRLWNLSAVNEGRWHRGQLLLFADHISNRSGFEFYPDGSSRFVSTPSVRLWGATIDAMVTPLWWLAARASVTVQRAIDTHTGLELPYKPRYQALASLGVKPVKTVLATAELNYVGERRYSGVSDANRGDPRLAPWWPVTLRVDGQVARRWIAFAKVDNVLDRGGEDFPGYPLPGRTFTAGVSYGERGISP